MNTLWIHTTWWFFGLFSGCSAPVFIKSHGTTEVNTPYGKVTGLFVEFPPYSRLAPVEAYFGLQFASIHSARGLLRFAVPNTPSERWSNIKYTNETYVPTCSQHKLSAKELHEKFPDGIVTKMKNIFFFVEDMTEDCLRLNIFVPTTEWNETSRLPVMVFVHGESYEIGTGNAYEGSVLASFGEVIVVTVNYRLGVLGFLSTGDQEASGNYALWDLFAVLSWVNENIGAFGGDTNRVTLFGHGHGAALVNILLLSPMITTRLVQRAILQSGSALSPWALSFDAVACTQWLAVNVKCDQYLSDSEQLVRCLRSKTATELVENVPLPPKYFSCFAPTPGGGQMFPDTVKTLLDNQEGVFSQIPIIFGVTRNEAYAYLKQTELVEGISKERKAQIIRTFVQNLYKFHRQKLYEVIDFQYTAWTKEQNRNTSRDDIMSMLSDGLYVAPLVAMAQEHATLGNDTYFYNFGYSTQSEDFPQWTGGVHGDELPYVFGAPLVNGISPFPSRYTKNEKKFSSSIMRLWTNFAKSGNPNIPKEDTGNEKFTDLEWPKYDIAKQQYLHLGKRPQIRHHYRGSEMALWLDLIPKINKPTDPNDELSSDTPQHRLHNANNLSLFDDPEGLVSRQKFHRIYPLPTSPPTSQRPLNDVHVYSPVVTDNNIHLSTHQQTSIVDTTDSVPEVTLEDSALAEENKNDSIENSSVPFSITVSIGCFLLFINILIYAGIFCQRERIRKLRKEQAEMSAVNENENNSNEQEYERAKPATNHISTSLPSCNHDSYNDPTYSTITISKEPTISDKHLYTQVPTQTNSPMHRTVVFQNSSMTSFGKNDHSLNHINKPPDRSPVGSVQSIDKQKSNICTGSVNAVTVV